MALGDPTETMPNVWTPGGPVEQMPNSPPPQNWCAAPPSIVSTDVFAYQAREVYISHTEAGHLAPDVVLTGALGAQGGARSSTAKERISSRLSRNASWAGRLTSA